jgi:hypothetical protein
MAQFAAGIKQEITPGCSEEKRSFQDASLSDGEDCFPGFFGFCGFYGETRETRRAKESQRFFLIPCGLT